MGWKMVRDNHEKTARADGVSGTWRTARHDEAVRALARKLVEEAVEYGEDLNPAELLDLGDVLDELLGLAGKPAIDKAVEAHQEKIEAHGRFRRHVMWSPLPGDSHPTCASQSAHEQPARLRTP